MDAEDVCTLCNKPLRDDVQVQVHEKGLKSLIKKSKDKEDDKWKLWNEKTSIDCHKFCRVRYLVSSSKPSTKNKISEPVTSASRPSESPSTSETPLSSDAIPDFDFNNMCFVCGERFDRAHKKVSSVQNNYVKGVLMDAAERRDDDWGKSVTSRLRGISSLVSLKASYHAKCYTAFLVKPREPKTPNEGVEATFAEISKYIEESGKFEFLLSDLKKIMGENVLSNTVLFKNLKQKYGDDIYMLQLRGKEPTVYYKTFNVSKICSDWFCNQESVDDIHKKTILSVAAEILRTEIIKAHYENNAYPAPSQFFDDVISDIPPLLRSFLGDLLLSTKSKNVTTNLIKRDFISHAIVSILRPKAFISTLQLGVGTYIYRKTGSRLIIDLLSKLGACTSYHGIQLHEASTIMDPPTTTVEDAFVQYVFDNTDHNVSTLNGKETFHCLGGIAVYTPEYAISHVGGSKKCHEMTSASELASQKRIQTMPYGTFNSKAMESIKFVPTNRLSLGKPPVLPPCYAGYLLAKYIEILKFPSWKGFMEVSSNDVTYEPSHIMCLPFINEPPSKLTTLNTSLHYAASESQKLGQKTCFVTYDQPLYWKARSIVAQSSAIDGTLKNVVVRLGFFYTQMSYLGSLGHVMDGSGLEELWSVVYAPESVKKMLSGHAYARAA